MQQLGHMEVLPAYYNYLPGWPLTLITYSILLRT
jgi:hypothetical protein